MNTIAIMTCLTSGMSIMTIAPFEWKIIGAGIAFLGCWLICQRVQLRRINREIDRFELVQRARVGTPVARKEQEAPEPVPLEPHRTAEIDLSLFHLTEHLTRVILLDSGTRKA